MPYKILNKSLSKLDNDYVNCYCVSEKKSTLEHLTGVVNF